MTHICLAVASEDTLAGALHTAWKLRVEKNSATGKKGNPRSSWAARNSSRSHPSKKDSGTPRITSRAALICFSSTELLD